MKVSICLTFLILASSTLCSLDLKKSIINSFKDSSLKEQFKVFHYIYNKEYDLNSEEGVRRYKIFKQNVKELNEKNTKGDKVIGINVFSDMTFEEWEKIYTISSKPEDKQIEKENVKAKNEDFFKSFWDSPDSDDDTVSNNEFKFLEDKEFSQTPRKAIDWRSHLPEKVRLARDCGWAIGVADTSAGNWHVANPNEPVTDFSAQQMYECVTDGYSNAAYIISNYVKNVGLFKEGVYPTRKTGKCYMSDLLKNKTPIYKSKYNDSNYTYSNWKLFYEILSRGPVLVRAAISFNWKNYIGGILYNQIEDCPTVYDRSTYFTAVGWGVENGVEYVLLRSTWGPDFGENGHIRVAFQPEVNYSCYSTSVGWRPSYGK
jgi:cathepsin L